MIVSAGSVVQLYGSGKSKLDSPLPTWASHPCSPVGLSTTELFTVGKLQYRLSSTFWEGISDIGQAFVCFCVFNKHKTLGRHSSGFLSSLFFKISMQHHIKYIFNCVLPSINLMPRETN